MVAVFLPGKARESPFAPDNNRKQQCCKRKLRRGREAGIPGAQTRCRIRAAHLRLWYLLATAPLKTYVQNSSPQHGLAAITLRT